MEIQKEREAFEDWWVDFHNGRQIACDYVEEDNSYASGYANAQWAAWQAAKADVVPDGCVLVETKDLREIISNAGDAMMDERTSSVYDNTGEPSTWFDHYTVAEKRVLRAIEAQEPAYD